MLGWNNFTGAAYDHIDLRDQMSELLEHITSGRFADEWDEQRDAGHPRLKELWDQHANETIAEFELDLRRRLGENVTPTGPAPVDA